MMNPGANMWLTRVRCECIPWGHFCKSSVTRDITRCGCLKFSDTVLKEHTWRRKGCNMKPLLQPWIRKIESMFILRKINDVIIEQFRNFGWGDSRSDFCEFIIYCISRKWRRGSALLLICMCRCCRCSDRGRGWCWICECDFARRMNKCVHRCVEMEMVS